MLALSALMKVYRLVLSPVLPQSCRFAPSCSEYAIEALDRHGAVKGGGLTLWRLARCQPWGGSGYDPVPGSDAEFDTAKRRSCAHGHQH